MARSLRKSGYATSLDLSEIGRLLQDVEGRLAQLSAFVSTNAREASSTVPDRISEALAEVSDRMRAMVRQNARTVEEATRMGTGVLRKIGDEVAHRPLVALAVVAGIGFLIGALNRR